MGRAWLPLPLAEARQSDIENKSLKVCLELVDGSHSESLLSIHGDLGLHLGCVEPPIPSQFALAAAQQESMTRAASNVLKGREGTANSLSRQNPNTTTHYFRR